MKSIRKQTTPYGCGMYALANLLDTDILFIEKIESQKNGGYLHDLIDALDEVDCTIHVLYEDSVGVQRTLPKAVRQLRVEKNLGMLLIGYQPKKDSIRHMVGAYIDNKGRLTVLDSMIDKPYVTNLSKFCKDNYCVDQLYAIYSKDPYKLVTIKNNPY